MISRKKTERGLLVLMLVFALVSLGLGVAFWLTGPEMGFLTVLFLGAGVYLALEAITRLLDRKR